MVLSSLTLAVGTKYHPALIYRCELVLLFDMRIEGNWARDKGGPSPSCSKLRGLFVREVSARTSSPFDGGWRLGCHASRGCRPSVHMFELLRSNVAAALPCATPHGLETEGGDVTGVGFRGWVQR